MSGLIAKALLLHDRACHWLLVNTKLASGYLFDASDRWVHRNVRASETCEWMQVTEDWLNSDDDWHFVSCREFYTNSEPEDFCHECGNRVELS